MTLLYIRADWTESVAAAAPSHAARRFVRFLWFRLVAVAAVAPSVAAAVITDGGRATMAGAPRPTMSAPVSGMCIAPAVEKSFRFSRRSSTCRLDASFFFANSQLGESHLGFNATPLTGIHSRLLLLLLRRRRGV